MSIYQNASDTHRQSGAHCRAHPGAHPGDTQGLTRGHAQGLTREHAQGTRCKNTFAIWRALSPLKIPGGSTLEPFLGPITRNTQGLTRGHTWVGAHSSGTSGGTLQKHNHDMASTVATENTRGSTLEPRGSPGGTQKAWGVRLRTPGGTSWGTMIRARSPRHVLHTGGR